MRDPVAAKVYVTDERRILGLFHCGVAEAETKEMLVRAGHCGLIACIGPCRCADVTHTFPRFYSVTPCVYVRGFGRILTMRIPMWVLHAILSISGTSEF